MQRGRTAAKVSTKLTLGLGPENEDNQKEEASGPARNGCKQQQSRIPEDEMSLGSKDWKRKSAIKDQKELVKQQLALREKEQYEQLMEKEHFQLQDTIRYYKDAGQDRTQMHEQLVNHMHALDYAQLELHMLRREIVVLQAETARLNDAILQQDRERESDRRQLVHQQSTNVEQRSQITSLTSELNEAKEAILKASSAPLDGADESTPRQASPGTTAGAAGICPFCHNTLPVSCCPHCGQPIAVPSEPGLEAAEAENSSETEI